MYLLSYPPSSTCGTDHIVIRWKNELRFNGEPMQDGGKIRHYGIKNGFHLVLALSCIGSLQTQVRMKERQLWERDFDYFEDIQNVARCRFLPDRRPGTGARRGPNRQDLQGCVFDRGPVQGGRRRNGPLRSVFKLRWPKLILKFGLLWGFKRPLPPTIRSTRISRITRCAGGIRGRPVQGRGALTKFVQDCILSSLRT